MKRGLLFVLLISLLAFSTKAQDEIEDSYDRLGLTVCFITYGNDYKRFIHDAMDSIPLPNKFYNNNLSIKTLSLPSRMEKKDGTLGEDDMNARKEAIQEFFAENGVGRNIVGKWYNYEPQKGFDLSTIFSRAEYNATDEEVFVSQSSKRGKARIRDYGHNLVSNSYVAVVDLRDVDKEVEREDNSTTVSYSAEMGYYLFKLQFGDKEINDLFDAWVYKDDSQEVKEEKLEKFRKTQFPLEPVLEKGGWSFTSGNARFGALDKLSGRQLDMRRLNREAFIDMINDSYNTLFFHAAKKLEKFKVKKKVLNTRPIQAKIGTKESLKTDDKYFVYEYVWDETAEKALPKRKGVLRAKKVADNREERSVQSTFYQIYGGSIQEGMVLREKPDLGLSIIAGYEASGPGGMSIALKYRMSKYVGIPALYLTADIAFAAEDYSGYVDDNYTYLGNFENKEVSFTRFDFGLGKGFQIARFFELVPFAAFGMITTEADDENDYSYYTLYAKPGVSLGVNLLHNLQAFGQVNIYGMSSVIVSDDEGETVEDWGGEKWSDEFPGQESGIGLQLGVRFEF